MMCLTGLIGLGYIRFLICGLWRNTENGPKDEIDCGIYYFRVP